MEDHRRERADSGRYYILNEIRNCLFDRVPVCEFAIFTDISARIETASDEAHDPCFVLSVLTKLQCSAYKQIYSRSETCSLSQIVDV